MALPADDPMLLEAIKIFEQEGYRYELKLNGAMMWVESVPNKWYAFYPTTGKWSTYGRRDKHYRSKGPKDFIDRFLKNDRVVSQAVEVRKVECLPDGVKSTLYEFLYYVYDCFEEGESLNKVYRDILRDMYETEKRKHNDSVRH